MPKLINPNYECPIPPFLDLVSLMFIIVITEPEEFSPHALDILRSLGRVILPNGNLPWDDLLSQADVLWVRFRHRIDRQFLEKCSRLKYIAINATGTDHIDERACNEKGVEIISLKGEGSFLRQVYATGEHTLALILALLRRIPQAFEDVKRGGWNRGNFIGGELHGKCVGVVGWGRLGQMVGSMLHSFGCDILTFDPHVRLQPEDVDVLGVRMVTLSELLGSSHIVTLHVNLTEDNRRFFNRECFQAMKQGSLFINTSRGDLVDEEALLEALTSGHLGGAALDVLSGESASGMNWHPLVQYARTHDNLIITPHIGGATRESMEKTEIFIAQKLARRIRGN